MRAGFVHASPTFGDLFVDDSDSDVTELRTEV